MPSGQTSRRPDPAQINVFLTLLGQLARVDPEFPLHYAICLAHISLDEGMSLTMLAEQTGLSLSTVSRIVGALSEHRQNGQSYGLVDVRISKEERRRKELYLTTKGWALMRSISGVLVRASS